jgi:methyl-accepting chemotaxis protein
MTHLLVMLAGLGVATLVGLGAYVLQLRAQIDGLRAQVLQARQAEQFNRELADELRRGLASESAGVRKESRRVRSLLADATFQLTHAFEEMNRQARAQDTVISRLLRRDRDEHKASNVRRASDLSTNLINSLVESLADVGRQRAAALRLTSTLAQQLDAIGAQQLEGIAIADTSKVLAHNLAVETARNSGTVNGLTAAATGLRRLAQRATGLNEQLRVLLPAARATAQQINELVGDAAHRDQRMCDSARERAGQLLEQLGAVNRGIGSGIREVEFAAKRIDAAVASAVRCLQVEDIAAQSLAVIDRHVLRIEAIQGEVAGLARTGAEGSTATPVEDFSGATDWRAPALRPVTQLTMLEGSVELF